MGDHLEIIIFSSILLILPNSLISLSELHKTPIIGKNLPNLDKGVKKNDISVVDLVAAAEYIPYYWIDDIFVTGILARVAGINHIQTQYMYRRVSTNKNMAVDESLS